MSTTALMIVPGMTLPNGATVIAASMRRKHQWIILAMDSRDAERPEYITWKCPRPTLTASETVHGHYFSSLDEAVADYYERP